MSFAETIQSVNSADRPENGISSDDFLTILHKDSEEESDTDEAIPTRIEELDHFTHWIHGSKLTHGLPPLNDPDYDQRRMALAAIADTYRYGSPLPHIDYTPLELVTWRLTFMKLKSLYPTMACDEYNRMWAVMERECQGFTPDTIPQLADVSDFLRRRTGFTLRPAGGYVSPRHFLYGLAFRVFQATQYIRPAARVAYTPEPDVMHELLGHGPMLAHEGVASLMEHFGRCSLGATDEELAQITSLFWHTIEAGLVSDGQCGQKRALGAALLSSFGELQHAIRSPSAQTVPFDVEQGARTKFGISSYQPLYFIADSLEAMFTAVHQWLTKMEQEREAKAQRRLSSTMAWEQPTRKFSFKLGLEAPATRKISSFN